MNNYIEQFLEELDAQPTTPIEDTLFLQSYIYRYL